MLSDSLLSSSHKNNLSNSLLIKFTCFASILLMIVVSSANRIKLKSVLVFTKSLIYVRKRRGPRIDPCGTPVVICSISEFWLSKRTYCCLLER